MYPSVAAAWPLMAREHEGFLPFPYLDTVLKVTAGIGTLLDDGDGDPPGSFLSLPWTIGGKPATRAQAASAWHVVKGRIDLAPQGGWAFENATKLRLPFEVASGLLMAKTHEFWSILKSQLPGLEEWPADAQLSLIDLSYQVGPHFLGSGWPNFTAAAHARDFNKCAEHCSVRQASAERNDHRKRLYRNAATVVALHIDPAVLWDHRPPVKEDEDMPISEEDITRIAKAVKAEVLRDIAAAVWTDEAADRIPSPDNLTKWLPSSYLQRIYLLLKPK